MFHLFAKASCRNAGSFLCSVVTLVERVDGLLQRGEWECPPGSEGIQNLVRKAGNVMLVKFLFLLTFGTNPGEILMLFAPAPQSAASWESRWDSRHRSVGPDDNHQATRRQIFSKQGPDLCPQRGCRLLGSPVHSGKEASQERTSAPVSGPRRACGPRFINGSGHDRTVSGCEPTPGSTPTARTVLGRLTPSASALLPLSQ